MIPWVGAKRELYLEAERTVPAIAKARISGCAADAGVLLTGYINDAMERGVAPGTAWCIYATAAANWLHRTIATLASEAQVEPEEVIARMVAEVAAT